MILTGPGRRAPVLGALDSACEGSWLACTRTVTILRTLTYMQKCFRHQNKPFRYRNEINKSKSIATQLFNQHTPIDTLVYEKFVCYNHTTKYTDVPYQMRVGGAFVYVCERGRGKDFEYNAVRYNKFFPIDPDDRIIMESQCSGITCHHFTNKQVY